MSNTFDVAVIGAGTMGSAAAYHIASRGKTVIAFDQFQPAHEYGSHSGRTRIIRHAYFESPEYVPLIRRADELWQKLESESNTKLLVRTGGLDIGPETGMLFAGALRACEIHGIPHEVLTADDAMKRWPAFRLLPQWKICYDPLAGFLLVDACIRAHLERASANGATLCANEKVLSVRDRGSDVLIRTDAGEYTCGRAVVSAGSWNSKLLAELQLPLTVKRKTVAWFRATDPSLFTPETFPVFLIDLPQGVLYGFPTYDQPGVKIANHHSRGDAIDPDRVDREIHESDGTDLREFIQNHMRGLSPDLLDAKVCMYTLTPDEHFILDLHPQHRNIAIAAGFSGHGFKFATVVGEILADLALDGATRLPIETFRIARFRK